MSSSTRKSELSGLAISTIAAVAVSAGAFLLMTDGIIDSDSQQDTGDLSIRAEGKKYALWEGMVVEQFDLADSSAIKTPELESLIYNFDTESTFITGHMDDALTSKAFNEYARKDGSLPPHFARVRHYGCTIAQKYNDRAATSKYGAASNDVAAYYERHCKDFKAKLALTQ